jgi:ATP-binding cassette, subfamily A (ABC1), member 3
METPSPMASSAATRFMAQTWALTKKNLLVAVVRHPISTFLRAIALPIALIVLVLEVKTFLDVPGTYGIGSPHPIQPLTSQLLGGQPLALVVLPNLGSDVDYVVQQLKTTLRDVPQQVLRLHNETELLTRCPVSIHGTSGCFGAIVFTDSPQTPNGNHVWSYKIRTDPIQGGIPFDVFSTTNQEDTLYFPLQLALENAMSNSSQVPSTYMFTQQTQQTADRQLRQHWLGVMAGQYSIALFIAMMSAVFHVASMMSGERQAGMARLIDVMGGSASARVVSYVLAFDIIYLPCWIVSGFGQLLSVMAFPVDDY